MSTSVLACGCWFSYSMFGDDRKGMGFCLCPYHANHPQVLEAKVCDVHAAVHATLDEWEAFNKARLLPRTLRDTGGVAIAGIVP